MKAPGFWFRDRGSWAARLLSPASLVYGGIARRRFSAEPRWQAPVPVICVGNPTLGGAGKTPTCLRIAQMLRAAGRNPVFLTRGYGGSERGTVLVGEQHTASEVGDEAMLLAAEGPTVVSAERVEGGRLAARHGDVIVMDDGFQNAALHKDLQLLVIDGEAGVGNGRVFPGGPLRLPLEAQLKKAHGLILVGTGKGERRVLKAAKRHDLPVLRARLVADPGGGASHGADELAGRRVYAFAGIGRPEKFFRSLEEAGAELAGVWAFDDHHPYTVAEAAEILDRARKLDALPVTTAKDLARLGGDQPREVRELREAVATLPVVLELDDQSAPKLYGLVSAALNGRDYETGHGDGWVGGEAGEGQSEDTPGTDAPDTPRSSV